MKLFIAHFILVEESAGSEVSYVTSSLFASVDAESAYATAQSWIPGHEDSTHNEVGELIHFYSSGLYELEEVPVALEQLQRAVGEPYGIEVGHLKVTALAAPLVPKAKLDLAVFNAAQPIIPAAAQRRR